MPNSYATLIAQKTRLPSWKIEKVLSLFSESATIPFIARYRQEATGGLDEIQLASIHQENQQFLELEKRKETILKTIAEQGKLSPELKNAIESTWTSNELEDLYLPYKPKRKTKASVARERGLEPLAGALMKQTSQDIHALAERFVKGDVGSADEALEGARHIIAEWVNERKRARDTIRKLFERKAVISSSVVKDKTQEAEKYRDYFDFSEKLNKIPSHRLLAIRRGENEGFLRVSISPPEEEALELLNRIFLQNASNAAEQVKMALTDGYKRLLKPAIETEFKNSSKARADEEAIGVFAQNLRQLLLTAPVGQKRTLGIDPGFKSGCKTVCLNDHGELLHNENIYPHPPQNDRSKAAAKVSQLVEAYRIEAIAIGNGTAGRETEDFIRRNVRFNRDVEVFVVNEAGASIYSASAEARKEFPDYDVTVRGAVSIGRRLMDPLAELVKIDPKAIGVGQYQHDVDQTKLKDALDRTVESVVNLVGVELNTASHHLLSYVSGLGPKLAESVISYRNDNGGFKSRHELLKVKGLGAKAFEQSAGFLRIAGAKHPLDNSAVHPESYSVVEKMASDLKVPVEELVGNPSKLEEINLGRYVQGQIGIPTLKNILLELAKAGRDPRGKPKLFSFDPNLRKIEDVKEGMRVPGIVTNITNFGAFVDIGVKQDGLIHVSEMADRFVSDPNEIVKLNQQLEVRVVSVDIARKRIQLSLKKN